MSSKLWLKGQNPYQDYLTPAGASWQLLTQSKELPPLNLIVAYSTPYSPVTLLHLAPFSFWEWSDCRLLWLLFNVLCAFYVPWCLGRLWYPHWKRRHYLFLTVLFLGGMGLRVGLGLGQHTLFWLSCFLTSLLFLSKQKNSIAGIFLAMSFHKFNLTIFMLPYYVVKRQWKVLGWTVFYLLCYLGAFFLRLPHLVTQATQSYLKEVSWWATYSKLGDLPGLGSTQLHPVIFLIFGHTALGQAAISIFLIGILAICALAWHRRRHLVADDYGLSILMLFCLLAVYHSTHDTVLLIIPAAFVMNQWIILEKIDFKKIILMIFGLAVWFVDASKVYLFFYRASLEELTFDTPYKWFSITYRLILLGLFLLFLKLEKRDPIS